MNSAFQVLHAEELKLENCTFRNNSDYSNPENSDIHSTLYLNTLKKSIIKNVIFKENKSKYKGGAIFAYKSSNFNFFDVLMKENKANFNGGAVFAMLSTNILIKNCILK